MEIFSWYKGRCWGPPEGGPLAWAISTRAAGQSDVTAGIRGVHDVKLASVAGPPPGRGRPPVHRRKRFAVAFIVTRSRIVTSGGGSRALLLAALPILGGRGPLVRECGARIGSSPGLGGEH